MFGMFKHQKPSSRCLQLNWQGHRCWCAAARVTTACPSKAMLQQLLFTVQRSSIQPESIHPYKANLTCLPCLFNMFAALRRKGKGDDVSEQQMDAVVRAHNGEQGLHICTWLDWLLMLQHSSFHSLVCQGQHHGCNVLRGHSRRWLAVTVYVNQPGKQWS